MCDGKSVLITEEMSRGFDEIWTVFFSCPNCGGERITAHTRYCPECGAKVHFFFDTTEFIKRLRDEP